MEYDKEQVVASMIQRFVELQDQKVLEIGCGDGEVSALLAPKAGEYIAIDLDRKQMSNAILTNRDVDFRVGNGEALEFQDASFHVVLFTLSLHHQNSHLALEEAHRVLTENGHLIILKPTADGELQQFFHLFDDETEKLAHALNEIGRSDFEVVDQETFCAIMEFNNRDELCHYPFGRASINPEEDDRILKTLQQLQDPPSDEEPIFFHDKINIFSLRKRSF
jgi:ubiquinone/menaquinone biosynthesis C-methylase UbiE